jgi:hypothetical protein
MATNILSFPSSLPTPQQLELPTARISGLLHDLNVELLKAQSGLLAANNAREFAAVVRMTTDKLSEASAAWTAMSETIRTSWHI